MRRLVEKYSVVPVTGGEVICFERGHRKEFLGADGLWHRFPKHCDPFTGDFEAAGVVARLELTDHEQR